MRIENLKATIKRNPHLALALAAIFHITLTLSVFAVGRSGVAPKQFDRDGIGNFASDGHLHKPVMDSLANTLKQGELGSWINSNEAFHVKIFSLASLVMKPLVGSNILTIEPVNLLYYLVILALTFTLARIIAGLPAAWLATLIVAVWPSFVLHGTQFLRDPLILIALLTLITLLVLILKENLNWCFVLACIVAGAVAIYLVWHTRPEMWMVITAIIFVCALLFLIKIAVTRKIVAANLLAMASLAALPIVMPRPSAGVVSQPLFSAVGREALATPEALTTPAAEAIPGARTSAAGLSSIWGRVAIARARFVLHGRGAGSVIDETVFFNSPGELVRYVPRALEIGYFAPFPSLWFTSGRNVGTVGRILGGVEMAVTYLFEALACFFVWQTRRRFSSWVLVLATVIGMLALGLVVTNVGTLYRMRYPFWILIVIMAASVIASKCFGWLSSERKPMIPASTPLETSPAK